MAAPFVVIMVLLCVSFVRDLHRDPQVLRDQKSAEIIGQAVGYGTTQYGDHFILRVQAFPGVGPRRRAGDDTTPPAGNGVGSDRTQR